MLNYPKSVNDRVFTEHGWETYLKKKHEEEYDHLIFSLRLVFHGLGSVFSTLYFLIKLQVNLSWYQYIVIILTVLSIAFIDKIVKFVLRRVF